MARYEASSNKPETAYVYAAFWAGNDSLRHAETKKTIARAAWVAGS